MKANSAILLLAAAAHVYAQDLPVEDPEAEYLDHVCLPTNSSGYPDFNAPCNAMLVIQYECAFGSAAGLTLVNQILGPDGGEGNQDLPAMQSNVTQRDCICSSQFFSQVEGCIECGSKHGDSSSNNVSPSYLSSVSSGYCAATYTPTVGLAEYLGNVDTPAATAAPTTGNSSAGTATPTLATGTGISSDPIGNKTEVSYYYTGSVTGSAAWSIPTTTGSLKTSNGQIVPTAAVNNQAGVTSSGSGASGTSSGSSGAAHTQAAAAMGVIGIAAGLAALL